MHKSLAVVVVLSAALLALPAASASAEMRLRVVNGQPAGTRDAPWMANVLVETDDGRRATCGGSLVAPDAVLTAAHCTDLATHVEQFKVRVGSRRWAGTGGLAAADVVLDAQHVDGVMDAAHDVAVIFLSEPLPYPTLRLATAPPRVGEGVTLFGWGATDRAYAHRRYPTWLRKAHLRILRNRDCGPDIVWGEMCAGERRRGRDACEGDSGGPLVRWRGDVPYQLGIVSYGGETCGLAAGVYADVPRSLAFIRQVLAEGSRSARGRTLRRR